MQGCKNLLERLSVRICGRGRARAQKITCMVKKY